MLDLSLILGAKVKGAFNTIVGRGGNARLAALGSVTRFRTVTKNTIVATERGASHATCQYFAGFSTVTHNSIIAIKRLTRLTSAERTDFLTIARIAIHTRCVHRRVHNPNALDAAIGRA